MPPEVLEYAATPMSRRSANWSRFAPFFAVVCAVFAWLKSVQHHGHGQLRDEQWSTLFFVALSLLCGLVAGRTVVRTGIGRRVKTNAMLIACILVLAVLDALALWNLSTATVGSEGRLVVGGPTSDGCYRPAASGILSARDAKTRHAMLYTRITVDPNQMGGVPCIRGLRVPAATVVGMMAEGISEAQILRNYPDLQPEDLREALRYAAEALRERELPLAGRS